MGVSVTLIVMLALWCRSTRNVFGLHHQNVPTWHEQAQSCDTSFNSSIHTVTLNVVLNLLHILMLKISSTIILMTSNWIGEGQLQFLCPHLPHMVGPDYISIIIMVHHNKRCILLASLWLVTTSLHFIKHASCGFYDNGVDYKLKHELILYLKEYAFRYIYSWNQ